MMKILLLEDDALMSETLQHYLTRRGYRITTVGSIEEAENVTFDRHFDLYLIDINLPDGDGSDFIASLRFAEDYTPTIFLTALTDIDTLVKCFELGAIDYLKKPFDPEELLVRIRAKFENKALHYDHITLYQDTHIVKINGETIDIPNVPRCILEKLMLNCGNIVIKEELYDCLEYGSDTALRVAISKLKKLLRIDIKNIRGRGYLLEAL